MTNAMDVHDTITADACTCDACKARAASSTRQRIDAALGEAQEYLASGVNWNTGHIYEWSDPALYDDPNRWDRDAAALASEGHAASACLVGVLLVGAHRVDAYLDAVAAVVASCLPDGIWHQLGASPTAACSAWNDEICESGEQVANIIAAARRKLTGPEYAL